MDIFLASVWVFLWELYWNFVWWGSIVTQFFLQSIIWIDIKNAIALDNSAVLGSEIWLSIMLLRKNKFEKWFILLIIYWILGSFLWVFILNILPVEILQIIFTIILFWIVWYSFIWKSSKNEKWFIKNRKNIILLSIWIFFIAIYSSFMSIWDFVIWLLLLTSIFHFKYHKALFILSITSVIIRLIATIEYFRYWLIDLKYFIPMFFSAMLAWFIAWYFVEKIDSKILEKLLKFIWIFLAIYIVFNLFK